MTFYAVRKGTLYRDFEYHVWTHLTPHCLCMKNHALDRLVAMGRDFEGAQVVRLTVTETATNSGE